MIHYTLFGMDIAAIDMGQAIDLIRGWLRCRAASGCRYVVTPNVDHAVVLREHPGLQAAYREADLVLADGLPIVWAARLLGRPLPERVAGSDLVPQLLQVLSSGRKTQIFLLGAAPGVGLRAAEKIVAQYPGVEIAGVYSPPKGFEKDARETAAILNRIAEAQPDLLVVGLGAPKQECWVHQHRKQIQANVALCVGATIDFLAGEKRRAPRWMQRLGVEWIHRMVSDPRRLVKRYAKDALVFPALVIRQWYQDRRDMRLAARRCE